MHLEDEEIQRFLHDELDRASRRTLGEHVAGCALCQGKLAEAEREEEWIAGRLEQVDDPAPAASPERIRAPSPPAGPARMAARRGRPGRARRRRSGLLRPRLPAPGMGGARHPVVRPLHGSVLPTSPGPTVRPRGCCASFDDRRDRCPPRRAVHDPLRASAGARHGDRPAWRRTEHRRPRVRGGATFTAGAGGLTVENQGAVADYAIELPEDAPWVAIEVGERQLLVKEGGRIVAVVPANDAGSYPLSLAAPGARE